MTDGSGREEDCGLSSDEISILTVVGDEVMSGSEIAVAAGLGLSDAVFITGLMVASGFVHKLRPKGSEPPLFQLTPLGGRLRSHHARGVDKVSK